jgi:DNA-binding MarR family transcriptional regulator
MDGNRVIDQLDDELAKVRVAAQRPQYRRAVLAGLEVGGGIATLRLLRAVENLSTGSAPSIKDVAARLGVEHSTASRSVEAAVRFGLLTKRACTGDLRRVQLELTPEGRRLLRRTSARRREVLSILTEDWASEDVERLLELLSALNRGFDALEAGK